MDELEGIDPNDIAELEAKAKKIVEDASMYYEITMLVPHFAAVDFLKKYDQAAEGDIIAVFELMSIIHIIAQSMDTAMHSDYTYDDDED